MCLNCRPALIRYPSRLRVWCQSYRVVPGHDRNWQIETAVWNLAGFLHCALDTRWQRFGQFLNKLFDDFLNDFLYENLNFLYENLRFSR